LIASFSFLVSFFFSSFGGCAAGVAQHRRVCKGRRREMRRAQTKVWLVTLAPTGLLTMLNGKRRFY
jgi:uncharacterized membrane protein